jgi:hypothetical protein
VNRQFLPRTEIDYLEIRLYDQSVRLMRTACPIYILNMPSDGFHTVAPHVMLGKRDADRFRREFMIRWMALL